MITPCLIYDDVKVPRVFQKKSQRLVIVVGRPLRLTYKAVYVTLSSRMCFELHPRLLCQTGAFVFKSAHRKPKFEHNHHRRWQSRTTAATRTNPKRDGYSGRLWFSALRASSMKHALRYDVLRNGCLFR